MQEATLSRIRLYPVKSLDPVEVTEAEVGIRSLRYDRAYAMLAHDGHFINGKRTGRVNQLLATYDLPKQLIQLTPRTGGEQREFHLVEQHKELEAYLTSFFETPVHLLHRTKGELMDIPGASSVTVVSEASLQSLHHDFQDHTLEDIRLRFRTNLEISGVPPYWEETLFGKPGYGVRFTVGDVEMIGISPRARCNVPPRDPLTGDTDKSFVKSMMKSRSHSLPEKSLLPLYGNTYHLTVNVYLPETEQGKFIHLGDKLEIKELVKLE